MSDPCPCGSGKPYDACCGPFHAGRRGAPTASALMRSRYAAFARGLTGYLADTWHPSTRPADLSLDADTVWTGLVIEATEAGRAWEDAGTVTFTASWRAGRRAGVLRERSRFVFEDGRWLYIDGDVADR
ncbi:YchJ family protein [Propioniciclava coleopterorum]|uniref:UPF0225 protein G7070_10060 n=1 Tax=Propioniciclava coleopterorum TaxID=2714937 RepID=A0A6G7Y6W0_9ACTN|nr:YchJ family protein [Propioniciclava coleopterorum]QIK72552.1 YchJ family protein [Propioniciclava coleopterorum]